jgi:acyl-CoA reductase-like NAD-dependent aldehyde dehydrogenase
MKLSVDLPDIAEVIAQAVENAISDKQTKLFGWKYFTLKETADLLQVKVSTLLDKRMPYLSELEYSQNGKAFWFKKESVELFISSRMIRKYRR